MEVTQWNILLILIVATGFWALFPSRALRELHRIAKESPRRKILESWGRYQTTRRFVTINSILMNAKAETEFNEEDMSTFNALLAKLNQPPAEFIVPEQYAPLPDSREADIQNASDGRQITRTAEVVQAGVRWQQHVLRKAEIKGCSADYVALSKASELSSEINQLSNFLGNPLPEVIILDASEIEEFINLKGLRNAANGMFKSLVEIHPERDFDLDSVKRGDRYVQRKMRIDGITQAGQNCVVAEVTHQGLVRKSDPNWRIPAFVKIQNIDTHE
jgi:hypothetical protein